MECCILFLYVFYMLSPDAQWSRSLDKVVKPFVLIVKYFNIILLYRPGFRFPLYLGSHLLLLHSLLHSLFSLLPGIPYPSNDWFLWFLLLPWFSFSPMVLDILCLNSSLITRFLPLLEF
jgi:hypothetical protein